MRIFTGAPIPDGADAVVMVERTRRLDDGAARGHRGRRAGGGGRAGRRRRPPRRRHGVRARRGDRRRAPRRAGRHRRRRGAWCTRGCGSACCPPATSSSRPASRSRRARSATRTGPRSCALVAQQGWQAVDLGLIRDDESRHRPRRSERGASTCDAVLTSGGVSMGDIDLVKVVLDRIGDMRWMQIAIRPAKPFAFGLVGRHAGVRAARQPGVVDGELRAARPARPCAGWPGTPSRCAPRCRPWPPSPSPGGPTARSTSSGSSPSATATGCCTSARPVARGPTTSRPWPGPHALLPLADGDGVEAGDPVRVLLLADV